MFNNKQRDWITHQSARDHEEGEKQRLIDDYQTRCEKFGVDWVHVVETTNKLIHDGMSDFESAMKSAYHQVRRGLNND